MTAGHGIARMAVGICMLGIGAVSAFAQQAPQQGAPGRDCQTVRTCNFTRTGDVRGCLSSYSCRTCRMVTVKCTLPNTSTCREMRCDWGG